jgi:shikimate kinase
LPTVVADNNTGLRPLVVFIGPPAAGKSRIGKRVARILDAPLIDTDTVIVNAHGPIAAIFATHGEAHFRQLEADAVAHALQRRAVVALGAGAVMTLSTAHALHGHHVVLLTTTAEAVLTRLNPKKRPLMRDGIGAWAALVAERAPTYTRLATAVWDTSSRPIDQIAEDIAEWVRTRADETGGS